MRSSRLFAVSNICVFIVLLLFEGVSSPSARAQVPLIDQPLIAMPASFLEIRQEARFSQSRSVGPAVRTAAGVRSRRRNAKSEVQNGPETVLYTFQGGNDGGNPIRDLIFDSSGNLHGATGYGGGGSCSANGNAGCGTVFELSPNGSAAWTETVLYSFRAEMTASSRPPG
jgi:hypothetical protein